MIPPTDTPIVMDDPEPRPDETQPNLTPVRSGRRSVAAGLVLVAVLAVAVGLFLAQSPTSRTTSGSVQAARSGHSNRIAFVDANGTLNAIGPDGSNLRSYPVGDVTFQFPAWSPDGGRIVAVGNAPTGGVIYVVDDGGTLAAGSSAAASAASAAPAGSTRAQPILAYGPSGEGPIYASWSPDGRRIAFLTNEPDGLALRTARADGSNGPSGGSVVHRGQPLYWAWIDAAHLLVHSGSTAQDEFLGELGLEGGQGSQTALPRTLGQFQSPGVSFDSAYRAFVATETGGETRVVVESRRGGSHVQASVVGASALGWSPTGDMLAFTAPDQAGNAPFGALQVMDARSGAIRTLLGGLVVAYFWSPDGRTVAALSIVLGNGGTTAAALPIAQATSPSLQLAFVDVASGAVRSERSVRLPDIVVTQFLPFFDQYAQSHRIWSPASDSVVLPLVDEAGQSHITIVPADGSKVRVIADGVAAFWSP